jgi:ATP adenylyltransferase
MDYINSSNNDTQEQSCIFCVYPKEQNDAENLVLSRGEHVFAMLNRYPYSTGHVLIIPYRHTPLLESLTNEEKLEFMSITQIAIDVTKRTMKPDGFNLGINLGKVAGAGIDSHLHLHIVPRWNGDINFMSVTAEAKVLPEALSVTWEKMIASWPKNN